MRNYYDTKVDTHLYYSFIQRIFQSCLLITVNLGDKLSEDLYVECDWECAPVIHLPLLSGFLVVSKMKAQERCTETIINKKKRVWNGRKRKYSEG